MHTHECRCRMCIRASALIKRIHAARLCTPTNAHAHLCVRACGRAGGRACVRAGVRACGRAGEWAGERAGGQDCQSWWLATRGSKGVFESFRILSKKESVTWHPAIVCSRARTRACVLRCALHAACRVARCALHYMPIAACADSITFTQLSVSAND